MEWTIPGTVITCRRDRPDIAEDRIRSMFLAGGISRSQVASLTGLEPHAVQNWVKRGFLSSPVGKKYSLRQLCRIMIINMLKGALPMEKICGLLSYVNGRLDDESDDLIDDTVLYFMFVRLASQARHIGGTRRWDEVIPEILEDYDEPVPGAKERIDQVLRIMLTAWIAVRTMQEADRMLEQLNETEKEKAKET